MELAETLVLSQALYDQVIAHCRHEAPKEACGIFAGRENRVDQVYEMTNADQSPISYNMDPREQMRVMKAMREAQQDMVAIYHSHTATEAYPSPVDADCAVYPEVFYVLVSLKEPQNPVMRVYRIKDKQITERKIEVRN